MQPCLDGIHRLVEMCGQVGPGPAFQIGEPDHFLAAVLEGIEAAIQAPGILFLVQLILSGRPLVGRLVQGFLGLPIALGLAA